MKKNIRHTNIAVTLVIAMFFFMVSCKNDVNEVQKATDELDLPLRVQYGIHYEYSDSSFKVLDLKAPEATDYSKKKESYREFAKGIEVTFYNDLQEKEAFMRSNYAKQFEDDNIWEARGDVVVTNKKGERLNTEHLTWDPTEKKIYSDKFVTFSSEGNTFRGHGFEADQNFETWQIVNMVGKLHLDEEEELNEKKNNKEQNKNP